jgi:hypothetical protein
LAQQYEDISDEVKEFIEKQKIFFVGTATADSKINQQLLPDYHATKIRHPSFGGKSEFINEMNQIIND